MVTMSINYPVKDIFQDEDRENSVSVTGGANRVKTKKEARNILSLYEEIDFLFKEFEENVEGIQTEPEPPKDSYNKSHLTNEERIKLLARKYIKKLTSEENARLEILCERVRQLFPRATQDDFIQLEKIGTELKDLEEENKRIIEKYNLD